jgi:hypothetical protein
MIDAETVARLTKFWENEVTVRDQAITSLRNDIATYNEVLTALKSGELTWDRVQVMETGQLRVTAPPQPIPGTCDEGVSKEFEKKNGKKETAVAALTEVASGT